MRFLNIAVTFFVCLTASSFGCSGRTDTASVVVFGSVTVAGQPLSGAVITFEPMEGTRGPKASNSVFNGQYRIDESAKLQPGKFRVRVSMIPPEMLKQLESTTSSTEFKEAAGRAIAAPFDTDSQLTAQLSAGSENQVDFQVAFR